MNLPATLFCAPQPFKHAALIQGLSLREQGCYAEAGLSAAPFGRLAVKQAGGDPRAEGCNLHQHALSIPEGSGARTATWEADISGNTHGSAGFVRLGDVRYDRAAGRLIASSGEELLLRWQSAQVLAILADNLGRIVARDDLIARVWGDVSVTDDSLTQCIADIRRALNDQDRALLKTLPKRGYMLNGVRENRGAALVAAQSAQPDPRDHRIIADLDPRDVLPTLAVLPMHNADANGADALGIFAADEVSNALCRSNDVNVISRLSTANFGGQTGEHGDLRRALNADYIISGMTQVYGGTAIVSVEFSETDKGLALWSDRIKIPAGDIVNDTDWVEHVVAQVRNSIMINEVRRVRTRPLESLRLFSILHGAVGLMHRLSPDDFNEARTLLIHLNEHAPHSAAPLSWIARWHVLRAMQGWSDDVMEDARNAISFADRALDLDPENTLAMTSIGIAKTNLLQKLDEAAGHYDAALQINPNDAQALALRGMLQGFTDQGAEGKRDAERAIHLTPRDPHRYFYLALAAGVHLSAQNYERAVILAKESRRLNPTQVTNLRMLAAAQMGMGDETGSRETVRELMQLQPDLRISTWQKGAPSSAYENGKRVAKLLKNAGVPD